MTDTDDAFWNKYADVLTTTELGQILRLKVPSVLVRLKNGTVPAHWIGGSWIIFTAEIRAWLPTTLSQQPKPAEDAEAAPEVDVLAGCNDVLNYDDLVRLFGKNKSTIYRWLNEGIVPAYRHDTHWVTHKSQLRDLLRRSSNRA